MLNALTCTRTYTALWCEREFLRMTQNFRKVRASLPDPMDRCFICEKAFVDGEMMALACFEEVGNKMLCQLCASPLSASEVSQQPAG